MYRSEFYQVTHKTETEDRVIKFDFCEPLPESLKCQNILSLATESKSDQYAETCENLTQQNGNGQVATLVNGHGEDHVQVAFTTDKQCQGDEKFGITFEIFCDKSVKEDPITVFNTTRSTTCRPFIEVSHIAGCKVGDLNGLWRFIEANAYIFGAVSLILGLYNLVLGRKFIRPTLGMIFCLVTVIVIMFLFYVLIFKPDIQKWVGWVILAISIILG